MNIIKHITDLFSKNSIYSVKKWNIFKDSLNSVEDGYITLIENGIECDDEVIAEKLLKTDFKDEYYRRVKRTLREKLLFEILQFEPSGHKFSAFQINYYKCLKFQTALKIMQGLEQHQICKYLAERILKISERYRFNELRMDAHRQLAKHYSIFQFDKKKAQYHREGVAECLGLLQRDTELENLFYKIHETNHLKGDIAGIIEEIEMLKISDDVKNKAPRAALKYYTIKCLGSYLKKDPKSQLKVANNGLQYFSNLDFDHKVAKNIMLKYISSGYLQLGHIIEAKQAMNAALRNINKWRLNWVLTKSQVMILSYHAGEYEEAYDHMCELTASKKAEFADNTFDYIGIFLLHFQILQNVGLWKGDTNTLRQLEKYRTPLSTSEFVPKFEMHYIAQVILNLVKSEVTRANETLNLLLNHCAKKEGSASKNNLHFIHFLKDLSVQIETDAGNPDHIKRVFSRGQMDNILSENSELELSTYYKILRHHFTSYEMAKPQPHPTVSMAFQQ